MMTYSPIAVGVAAIVAVMAASPAATAQTARSGWLDPANIVNWNKPGVAIPRGPKMALEDIRECEKRGFEGRKASPATAETRAVTGAGWSGATVEKRAGDVVFVFARNGVDGMCRPLAYQIFVFVAGRFAGTLSPRPMDSREDGSGYLVKEGVDRFTAEFARFAKDDALCCPSRTSTVTYRIQREPAALVVPEKAVTKKNPQ